MGGAQCQPRKVKIRFAEAEAMEQPRYIWRQQENKEERKENQISLEKRWQAAMTQNKILLELYRTAPRLRSWIN